MGEPFSTACIRIEVRPTGLLVADRGSNLLTTPQQFLSAAPKGGSCGGIFPIRLGQSRRRSSLGRDELLLGGATQKYPVILDGLPIQF
jgi:hypothetical protein